MNEAPPLLSVRGVKKYFPVTTGVVRRTVVGHVQAVDGTDFTIQQGDTFGLVGESGCGKTTLSRLLLLTETLTEGVIEFEGRDISRLDREGLRDYRKAVQPVFQDPYSSLNPRMPVWEIITEPAIINQGLSKDRAKELASDLLERVGLNRNFLYRYPHQFSGGQRQRVAIARALSCEPKFLVLDEPVSALDVSIRAQIMNLLKDLQRRYNLTLFMIAHDLGVVRYMCETIAVMYLGQIVEMGPAEMVYSNPLHPYTQALLSSALPYDPDTKTERVVVRGEVPSRSIHPAGAAFIRAARSRCRSARRSAPSSRSWNRGTGLPAICTEQATRLLRPGGRCQRGRER